LITGAASGIGYEISVDFAKEGAKIVLTDINEEAVQQAADELKGQGFDCIGIKCDVTSEVEIKAAIDKTVETFGSLD
ncbi:SDR family NAD(P)-dependent oxidoreductase, partial [Streptococcus pneumoniae]|nr:SDR family NAD(P)-dependent oxidoreductase [Streptococcus pneumoniae]